MFTATLLLGAGALLGGVAVWTVTGDVRGAIGGWLLFLVGTIAAERLELSRAMVASRQAVPGFLLGAPLFGCGLLALTVWLARNDVATVTIRMVGQARFMASAMLLGYVWLPVAGLQLIAAPAAVFAYDLVLHAVLIGFVLSMVFGHALIILPSVARIRLRYHPWLYLPLGLLHASVVLRVIGDLFEQEQVRLTSGPLTAFALLCFAAILALVRRHRPGSR